MNAVRYSSEVLFKSFEHIKIEIDPEQNAVWVYLDPEPIPCITTKLLSELKHFQNQLIQYKGKLPYENELVDIKYHVVTSHHPVFSFGGDLDHFCNCIEHNDAEALRDYAYSCIDTMYPNYNGFDLDITTVSLIHGNALGGGLEAALSSNVLIVEKGAEMGLPEVLFNLFPGMGAYNLIAQRINPALAEKMILSGKLYDAEELYDMGLFDVLVDKGRGVIAVNEFIESNNKRNNTQRAVNKVRKLLNPVQYKDLISICDLWVEAALNLSDKDKRTMKRLVRSQQKYAVVKQDISHPQLTTSEAVTANKTAKV